MRNRSIRCGAVIAMGMTVLSTAGICQGQGHVVTVGPNVHVSKMNDSRQHWETQVAADPTNSARLIGCSIISPPEEGHSAGDHKTIVYASSDGGKSWRPTLESPPGMISRDPTCAFGPDGTAYFVNFAFSADAFSESSTHAKEETIKKLFVYRSEDGGKTWAKPVGLQISDRPFLVIDHSNSKYRGRVYLTSNSGVRRTDGDELTTMPLVFHSSDKAMTFADPLSVLTDDNRWIVGPGNAVVLSDGTLVWGQAELKVGGSAGIPHNKPDQSNARLKILVSADGGTSFLKATVAGDWYLRFYDGVNSVPSLGADASQGPFKDRVYAAWSDARSGRSEILLSFSSDKGKTWSKPVAVNDDAPRPAPGEGPDDQMPTVAVNSAGVVGVMWYDRRDNPDNLGWYARFSASLDGGETFLPSVRVAEAPHFLDPRKKIALDSEAEGENLSGGSHEIFVSAFAFMGGDTAGMAADADGVFHPFWVDNRTGVAQIWSAPVTVSGNAVGNGSADLQDFVDVTAKLEVEFKHTSYDPNSQKVTGDICLTNRSPQDLSGPIKIRILSLASAVGPTDILDSDNESRRSGAVWDLSAFLLDGRLPSGKTSKPRHFEMRVNDPKLFHPIGSRYAVSFASLRLKVLAKTQ
jgi:hypothetical protein